MVSISLQPDEIHILYLKLFDLEFKQSYNNRLPWLKDWKNKIFKKSVSLFLFLEYGGVVNGHRSIFELKYFINYFVLAILFDSINNCHVAISCNFDIDYIMIEQVFNILLFIIFAIFLEELKLFMKLNKTKLLGWRIFKKNCFITIVLLW